MGYIIRVIKARKRTDIFKNGKPIEDTEIIGTTKEVIGAVPESYIKYMPNKIFDKRKYPDLYALFGKDHLPNELEIELYEKKVLSKNKKSFWQKLKDFLFW